MTRKYYDEQLDALHAELINMGQMISGAIGKAVAALLSRDTASAREVIAYDDLGCESVKRFTVENFPLFVAIDANGNSIFKK